MASRQEIDRILDVEYGGEWDVQVNNKTPRVAKRELFRASFEGPQELDVADVAVRAEVRQAIVAEDAAFHARFRAQGRSNFRPPIFKTSKQK